MANLDLKKLDKALYTAPSYPVEIDVPSLQYLMIDGHGNPNTEVSYQVAVQAIYGLAYGIRMICKAMENVFTVMPLEGLWWFETGAPVQGDPNFKDKFFWTLLIRQPEFVTPHTIAKAREMVAKKKTHLPVESVRLEHYKEGHCVQIMHLGSYDSEVPTIAQLHNYMEKKGYSHRDKHHEIYLNDPRTTAPEKLKTIIRQPITLSNVSA